MTRFAIALLAQSALLVGCEPSPEEIVEEYRPAYRDVREQLPRLAKLIAEAGNSTPTEAVAFDPPFVFVQRSDQSNAEAIMFEQLTDPELRPPLDLYLSDSLLTALAWTAEGRTIHPGGDPDFMERTLKSGLSLKYLVVHRAVEIELPQAINFRKYTTGHVALEGLVIDLDSESIVTSYQVSAEVPPTVEYQHKEGEPPELRLEEFARSAMWTRCRDQIEEELRRVTGGRVEFE